ncbi:hypothetical protein ACFLQ2_05210 [archaeon]
MAKQKLDANAFALACGAVTGLWLFIATIYSMLTGDAAMLLGILVDMYPGYSISAVGAVIGAVYGFIEAGVTAYVFVWLYNKL